MMSPEEKLVAVELLGNPKTLSKIEALLYLMIQEKDGIVNFSMRGLSSDWNWNVRTVKSFLDYLSNKGIISVDYCKKSSVIKLLSKRANCINEYNNEYINNASQNSDINILMSRIYEVVRQFEYINNASMSTSMNTTPKKGNKERLFSSPITSSYYPKEINKEKVSKTKTNKLVCGKKYRDEGVESSQDNVITPLAKEQIPLEKKKEDCDKREEEFYQELSKYVNEYGRTLVREFFDYWTERNKGGTKMRFEMQPTWQTSKRLATWSKKKYKS